MRLVFAHGWSFGPEVWDDLASLLHNREQARVDLGYFGPPSLPALRDDDILIAHSMGLFWGLSQQVVWRAVIAINSFTRFPQSGDGRGCVSPAALRAMRKALTRDADCCVWDFRHSIGAAPPPPAAHEPRLAEGLNLLRDFDAAPYLGRQPSLVLASENDPLAPPAAASDLAKTSRGRLALHPTGGHGLPWTAPDWCATQILGFLQQNGC